MSVSSGGIFTDFPAVGRLLIIKGAFIPTVGKYFIGCLESGSAMEE
jgi:hypothetical protein